jgi:hypothetical protein
MSEETQNIEAEESEQLDFEVEEIDDRPVEDRVEPKINASKDFDVSDEEIASYSENVQKRIKQLKYEFHEERRAKEAAQRQNEEAIKIAQNLASERDNLRQTINRGNEALFTATESKLNTDLDVAEKNFKEAYEEGDADKISEAQRKLTEASVDKKNWEQYKPPPEAEVKEEEPLPNGQEQPQVVVDQRAKAWLTKNQWFGNGPDKNAEMTGFAYGVHEDLVRSGVDPNTRADEYYAEVDKRIQERFPEHFGEEASREETSAPQPVVASARRSSGKTRKVQLTKTQVDLARRLGITKEQYAAQIAKETAHG